MSNLTFVIAIKNRPEKAARKCLESLLNQTHPCNVTIVDFGSSEDNLVWERELFSEVNFIEAKTDLEHYSSSRALNIGIKRVETPFTLITDIDLIFSSNFAEEVTKALGDKTAVLCQRVDLDKDGNEIRLHSIGAYGACFALSTAWLKEVRGFDEKFTYWGREDDDLFDRIKQAGFETVWLDTDVVSIKHQWHPTSSMQALEKNMEYYRIPNKPLIRNDGGWGKI